jgi:multidrug efflux pump subunit AcrA (membrane-fusion protein)
MVGAAAAGLNQGQQAEIARQQTAAQQQAEIARQQAAAQQRAEITRQQQTPSVPDDEKTAPFSCIVVGKDAGLGILENRCAFKIDVTYCVEKGDNTFRCDLNQFGSFTIAANGRQTTAYGPSDGRLYALVCRSPHTSVGSRWDGTRIVGTCQ